ncbi:hypothetical protein J6590_099947 [Homalodisca vitripennis]|nr:hypothetical protein J6590_099947 [Homalodisca vitripennis]
MGDQNRSKSPVSENTLLDFARESGLNIYLDNSDDNENDDQSSSEELLSSDFVDETDEDPTFDPEIPGPSTGPGGLDVFLTFEMIVLTYHLTQRKMNLGLHSRLGQLGLLVVEVETFATETNRYARKFIASEHEIMERVDEFSILGWLEDEEDIRGWSDNEPELVPEVFSHTDAEPERHEEDTHSEKSDDTVELPQLVPERAHQGEGSGAGTSNGPTLVRKDGVTNWYVHNPSSSRTTRAPRENVVTRLPGVKRWQEAKIQL